MSEDLFERLRKVGKLPTPPGVVLRLLDLTRREEVSLREIADTICLDPALTAKILKFANSPMAGLPRKVTSLQQAVGLIGMRGVKMMALSFSMLASETVNACAEFDQQLYWGQSLACGVAAKRLARRTDSQQSEEAFMAGLLSQIGRSIFASAMPAAYARVLAATSRIPADLPAPERATFGESYATIGAKLLAEWGIPEHMVAGIGKFRDLDGNREEVPSLARLLNVAEVAATTLCPDPRSDTPSSDELCSAMERYLKIEPAEAIALLQDIADEVEEMRKLMEMPKGKLRSPEEIESEVQERVAELSLATHLESQTVHAQNKELLKQATTDKLTGLKNRAAFDERLHLELQRADRSGHPLALMMIDVDKFKTFNDTHGHLAGDRVLHVVAEVLDNSVRKVDFVARYGGEEFAVIVPDTRPGGVIGLAERLREGVEDVRIGWEGQRLRVTVSIGVAVISNVSAISDPQAVISLADEQLYLAKENGRNRVEACIDGKSAVRLATV